MGTLKLLQGNEACAEGALYAGCTFFAGYPITPSTEVAEYLARRLPLIGGVILQMEDEIASVGAIIGASLAGKKAMTATSGPGFSLKQENIGFGMICEVPIVVIDVMRGGPSTGVPTGPSQSDIMQCKWGTHGDHPVICLTPAYVQEIFSETVRAFNLAERYRTPVFVAYDEIVGHMRERIEIPDKGVLPVENRRRPTCSPSEYMPFDDTQGDVPPIADFFSGYRQHITGLNHAADGFPVNASPRIHTDELRLLRKVEGNRKDIIRYETVMLEDAEIVVFGYGVSGRSGKSAVELARAEGIKAGLFRPLTIWPFPAEEVAELASRVKAIIVPELSLGQIVLEVERCAKGRCEVEGIFRVDGDPILERIKEVG